MSAYSNGRGSHIVSLSNVGSAPGGDDISRLPEITHEIENYFKLAGQLELSVSQERHEKRRLQAQLKEVQNKLDQITAESDSRIRELCSKEDALKAQLTNSQDKEKEKDRILKSVEIALSQEQEQKKKYQEHVAHFQARYSQFCEHTKVQMQGLHQQSEQLKLKIISHQRNEKTLHDQVSSLTEQVKATLSQFTSLKEEKRRTEVDLDLMTSKLQQTKHQEESWRSGVAQLQERNRTLQAQVEHQSHDLNQSKSELVESKQKHNEVSRQLAESKRETAEARQKLSELMQQLSDKKQNPSPSPYDFGPYQDETDRYYAVMKQVGVRTRESEDAAEEVKSTINSLKESLSQQKQRVENLEEQMKKEKREKQIALTCLHTAESRLAQVTTALDESKKNQASQFCEQGLELQF